MNVREQAEYVLARRCEKLEGVLIKYNLTINDIYILENTKNNAFAIVSKINGNVLDSWIERLGYRK